MAFPWTIDKIVVGQISPQGPVFPTTNSQGIKLPPPNGDGTIWTPGQIYLDGNDGSIAPVTFQVPSEPSLDWRLPMTISATIAFPEEWYGQECKLMGSLNGVQVVENDVFEATATQNWTFNELSLMSTLSFINPANPEYTFWIPFRTSGDWSWAIQLELSFAVYPLPPNNANPNPLWPESGILESQPDFRSSYPVVVQRYAFPNLAQLGLVPNNLDQALRWYIYFMVANIWNLGNGNPPIPYDSNLGASGFNMNDTGGVFALTQWIQGPPNTCNSLDLAAVLQLGCSIALSPTGSEILRSTWVFQYPRGYILNGELFGQPQFIGCNNPFYLNQAFNNHPICEPPDPLRSYFSGFAWVEVQFAGPQSFVIDVAHAVEHQNPLEPLIPEIGTNNRAQYLALHQDPAGFQALNRNGNAINNTGNSPVGNCYQNPDYRLPRIGVFGTDMDPPPPPLPGALVPGEPTSESRKFIQARASQPPQPPRFTTASLRCQILTRIMSRALDRAVTIVYSQLYPNIESTARNFVFNSASTSHGFHPQLSLNIQVHNTQGGATTALADYLSSFSVKPLTEHVRPTPTPLGDISLCCQDTILLVHGNVYAKLHVILDSSQISIAPKSSKEDLLSAAVALDAHLSSSGDTDQTSISRGSVPFTIKPPKKVEMGTFFTLQVPRAVSGDSSMESIRDEKVIAIVSNPQAIMSCGPADSEGNLTFAAFNNPGTVEITVVRPNIDTLLPEVAAFKVDISDTEG
ncbi:uncharacterized protein N7498_009116 [Penicillium cinerascens]|uniref:Uncharacterized protein n=1 Tax=Penicillium cinerascens TaxID=70096 RepID=A0A9W9J6I0_9EURO|nr:uncharacterized protein N7498_009116 [Penicillium cinerascens]KAJ5190131.1 hypothetical protein N7498_009116 [Penicillium cinerascens]